MNIGIIAYFNPAEFKAYLHEGQVIPNINKAASSVNAIALGLLKAGHRIIVISSYDEKGPNIHLSGERLDIYLTSTFSRMPKASNFTRWYMVRRLRALLAQHVGEMDVLHAHWTYDFAMAATAFAKSKPVFCSIRDWAPVIRGYMKGTKAKAMWWFVSELLFRRVMSNRKVHFIANSSYIYELVKRSYPQSDCCIIGNPIMSSFIVSDRTDYPQKPVFVSITQDLSEERKNYQRLLKAFAIINKVHADSTLILIGKADTNTPTYQSWVNEGLTKNVVFKGFVDHDALKTILDHASALVHPSLEESFGNTLLEGMARRLPVIGGKESGAVPHVLGEGQYGLLCDVTTPKELSDTMLAALNITEMRPMLDRATTYLKTEHDNQVIAEKHLQLFKQVLSNNAQD